ncbi:PREDICTED: uncharacterized protein LOC109352962 [Lupinus angustifolius]|uniref:uncharacterized protein LOC109352962 n=1 Tax=Lupinus angustifolius TaxID=3871 RepID=UPI00092F2FDE|nr:PREDICTED: uncharacterized protein LOC109352962 [Lupinus angustifolius]
MSSPERTPTISPRSDSMTVRLQNMMDAQFQSLQQQLEELRIHYDRKLNERHGNPNGHERRRRRPRREERPRHGDRHNASSGYDSEGRHGSHGHDEPNRSHGRRHREHNHGSLIVVMPIQSVDIEGKERDGGRS